MTDQEASDAERTFIHGPKIDRVPDDCDDCNYDTHTCGGCGEWLYHGTSICGPCQKSFAEDEAEAEARRNIKVGDRVRMTGIMPNDPAPMEVGSEGTVNWTHGSESDQIGVDWDNGRGLILLRSDPFIVC